MLFFILILDLMCLFIYYLNVLICINYKKLSMFLYCKYVLQRPKQCLQLWQTILSITILLLSTDWGDTVLLSQGCHIAVTSRQCALTCQASLMRPSCWLMSLVTHLRVSRWNCGMRWIKMVWYVYKLDILIWINFLWKLDLLICFLTKAT